MILNIFAILLYGVVLVGILLWARKSAHSKRVAIKKYFNWEDHQIRSTGYNDPRIRKYTSIAWSFAFVMAGIIAVPFIAFIGFGDSIWLQILAICTVELACFVAGLVIMKWIGIIDWYLECYICNFKLFKAAFILTIAAIILGNVSLIMSFDPFGLLVQLAAVGIMAIALYFMISPILEEKKYYLDRNPV